jgi:hypothetical protein
MKSIKVRLVGLAVVASACSGSGLVSPDWRAPASVLTFSASSQVVPTPFRTDHAPSIETTIVITNNNKKTISVNYSRCFGYGLRLYTTADLSGTPIWETSWANIECAAIGYSPTQLAPGESVNVLIYSMVSTILDSAKSAGTYYTQAYLDVGGGDIRASRVQVPAGLVQLSR